MNAKTAKLLRVAAQLQLHHAEYEPFKLHHPGQVPTFETYTRTIREMGPVSPGAPTNTRLQTVAGREPSVLGSPYTVGRWIPRAGARAFVTSREVEKIRYNVDGKTPRKALMHLNKETGQYDPQYLLIPILQPVELKLGSSKRVYRQLKKLERTIGLEALAKKLAAEATA